MNVGRLIIHLSKELSIENVLISMIDFLHGEQSFIFKGKRKEILLHSTSLSIESFSSSTETIGSAFDVALLCFITHNFIRGRNRILPSQFLIENDILIPK